MHSLKKATRDRQRDSAYMRTTRVSRIREEHTAQRVQVPTVWDSAVGRTSRCDECAHWVYPSLLPRPHSLESPLSITTSSWDIVLVDPDK